MKDFIKKLDKDGDALRAFFGLTAFLGANMATLSCGRSFMPLNYGLIRRLLYTHGVVCCGFALGMMADKEARSIYDLFKNYKSYNETDNPENSMDKEEKTDAEENLGSM